MSASSSSDEAEVSPVGEASPAFSGKEEEEQQQHEGQTKEEEEETEDFNIGRLEVLEKLLKDIQDDTFSTLYQTKKIIDSTSLIATLTQDIAASTAAIAISTATIVTSSTATAQDINQIRGQFNDVDRSLLDLTQGLERLDTEARNHSTAYLYIIHLVEQQERNNQATQAPVVRRHLGAFFGSVIGASHEAVRGARRARNWIVDLPLKFWAAIFFIIVMTMIKIQETNQAAQAAQAVPNVAESASNNTQPGSWTTLFRTSRQN